MFILLSALVGGGATFLALWPFGVLIAILAAPFGGSMAAALAAVFIASTSSRKEAVEQAPDGRLSLN